MTWWSLGFQCGWYCHRWRTRATNSSAAAACKTACASRCKCVKASLACTGLCNCRDVLKTCQRHFLFLLRHISTNFLVHFRGPFHLKWTFPWSHCFSFTDLTMMSRVPPHLSRLGLRNRDTWRSSLDVDILSQEVRLCNVSRACKRVSGKISSK